MSNSDDISFKNLYSSLSAISPLVMPVFLSFLAVRKGLKFIMEQKIKDIDKNVLFNCLIENRIFLESLTDDDVNRYYKIFVDLKRNRFKQKIFNFFRKDVCNEKFNKKDIEE